MSQFPPGYYPPPSPTLPPSHQLDAIHAKLDEIAVDVAGLKSRPPLVDVRPPRIVTAAAWVVVVLFTTWLAISTLHAVLEIIRSQPWKSEAQKRAEEERRWKEVRDAISR